MGILKWVQGRATKMMKGLHNMPCEEQLKQLRPFSLEKQHLQGTSSQYSSTERAPTKKIRENAYKLQCETFHLDRGKNFFTVKTIIHWNKLPGDMTKSALLEIFNM